MTDYPQCQNGHDLTPENTYPLSNGRRRCRLCQGEYAKLAWKRESASFRLAKGVRHCEDCGVLGDDDTMSPHRFLCKSCRLARVRESRKSKHDFMVSTIRRLEEELAECRSRVR